MYRPAFNRTDGPVLIDADGRQLGGHEWGAVDTTSDEVKSAVQLGRLSVFTGDALADDASPEAKSALERAGVLEDRRGAYAAAEADAVRKAAANASLELAADLPVADVRRRLVHLEQAPGDLLPRSRRQPAAATSGGDS